ncbi:MAG: sigma-70 family RNA polymerase sigma factor [Anaerolineaceae bacterium]|nr:sigma-70 family RNA polymerase sigma factor [Anaerolineaceae bacterium]
MRFFTQAKSGRSSAAGRVDEADFQALFDQNWDRLVGVLFQLTGETTLAEDLALEAFWRLWQQPPPDYENLPGWLYRVAVRLGYNELRARRRRSHYEQQGQDDPGAGEGPHTPEEAYEQAELRRRIRAILRDMPARQCQILVLRHAGLSYQEVAAALNISTGSVGPLLGRAESNFLRLYEASGGEHAPDS